MATIDTWFSAFPGHRAILDTDIPWKGQRPGAGMRDLTAKRAAQRTDAERGGHRCVPAIMDLDRHGQNDCIAVARKNWTFCGSNRGGDRAAAIYTLIATAKLNDIAPEAWAA